VKNIYLEKYLRSALNTSWNETINCHNQLTSRICASHHSFYKRYSSGFLPCMLISISTQSLNFINNCITNPLFDMSMSLYSDCARSINALISENKEKKEKKQIKMNGILLYYYLKMV
jgi:hypothetical protein